MGCCLRHRGLFMREDMEDPKMNRDFFSDLNGINQSPTENFVIFIYFTKITNRNYLRPSMVTKLRIYYQKGEYTLINPG